MLNQMIQATQDLMTLLNTLPGEIAAVQIDLNAAKLQLAGSEKTLADIEAQTMLTAEGSNPEKRKADCAAKLAANTVYLRWAKAADLERQDVARLTAEYDLLLRQFQAAGYQSKLHAELMHLLAESRSLTAVGDLNFYRPGQPAFPVRPNGSNGAAGHVTGNDAADIGL